MYDIGAVQTSNLKIAIGCHGEGTYRRSGKFRCLKCKVKFQRDLIS